MNFVVEFLDRHEGVLEEEIFVRDDLPRLLDSIRTRIIHDPDLRQDCCGLDIHPVV